MAAIPTKAVPKITKETVLYFIEKGFRYHNLKHFDDKSFLEDEDIIVASFKAKRSFMEEDIPNLVETIPIKMYCNKAFMLRMINRFNTREIKSGIAEFCSCYARLCTNYDHRIIREFLDVKKKLLDEFVNYFKSPGQKTVILSVKREDKNYTVTNLAGDVVSAFTLDEIDMYKIYKYVYQQYARDRNIGRNQILLDFPDLPKLAIVIQPKSKHYGKIGSVVRETKLYSVIQVGSDSPTFRIEKKHVYNIYDI